MEKKKIIKEKRHIDEIGEPIIHTFLMFVTTIICLTIFGVMQQSFLENLTIVEKQSTALINCQKYLEEFKKQAHTSEILNAKIMEIEDGYLEDVFIDNLPVPVKIKVTDITKLSSKYESYEKGIVKQIDFTVLYTYKNKQYPMTLSTVVSKVE